MEIELTYTLIALISVLGLLLVVFIFLYVGNLRNLSNLKTELEALKKEKEELQENALQSTNNEAKQIIDTANKKAAEIISSVSGISEQERVLLNQSFEKMLNSCLKEYQSIAGKFSQTYDDFIGNVRKDVKARLDMGLNKVISDSQVEMKNVSSAVNASLQNLYKGYETEVFEYKKGILSQIDKLGVDIIKQVSLKVLGKTLSKKEQEDLVIKSLEEAKKMGFFQ